MDHSAHDKHAGHKTSSFLTKFWIALVLAIPFFLYSDMAMMFGIWAPGFVGSRYLFLVLGSVIFFYCGWVFLASAYRELRGRMPGMMTLIALAITSAYIYSAFSVLAGSDKNLFWELSSLIAIMLLGHWIEMKSVQGAKGALKELAKLLPDTAEVVRGGKTENVSLHELHTGDIVLVKPGAKVQRDNAGKVKPWLSGQQIIGVYKGHYGEGSGFDQPATDGKIWVVKIGDQDNYQNLMNKGVTHFSKYSLVSLPPAVASQLENDGKSYDEVPKTMQQLQVNDSGGAENFVRPFGTPNEPPYNQWPNIWNQLVFQT